MSMADICNLVAWLLAGVVGFFLLADFVWTELADRKSKQEDLLGKGQMSGNETIG